MFPFGKLCMKNNLTGCWSHLLTVLVDDLKVVLSLGLYNTKLLKLCIHLKRRVVTFGIDSSKTGKSKKTFIL